MPNRLTLTLLLAAALTPSAYSQATLHISADKPLHPVSPTLYGLMTEEINYSYDGGLYPELIRNRTFGDHDFSGILHWNIDQAGTSAASMYIDETTGPSEALTHSLHVTIDSATPEAQAGVRNEGFWGIALRPSTTYRGSFYAKADTTSLGPLTVALVSSNFGQPVATATIPAVSTTWQRYPFTLTTPAKLPVSAQNTFRITAGHPGQLWLDVVSLMPPTYMDRENGLRPDLMQKMAAMHPTFVRLPGGNYLEGNQIHERYDWKTTIGPLADRPTHPSPWGYQSSDGLGLMEFLQWSEDLHSSTVLAVYAGYSLRGDHIAPGPALIPFVQDALDEIEFATGPVTSPWGARRAALGHPAPFSVQYVEIGNEDNFDKSGSYEGRYAQFYKAIKAKHPELQLIATEPLKRSVPDVIDDHYYRRSDEFFADTTHYDTLDRRGPKIFVGEWATREGSPTTNMMAALGDAAWMTGMERNSDLIVMSSYAPLFVNVSPGAMQWESNLLGYDALTSYGSPGYYAQVMFSGALGTEVSTAQLTGGNRLFTSVTRDPAHHKLFIKLVNADSTPQAIALTLDGTKVASTGTLVTLSGQSPAETNTITDPDRIHPTTTKLTGAGPSFTRTLPPYTIQVLTLETN